MKRIILLTMFLLISGCEGDKPKIEFINNSMLQGNSYYIEFVNGDRANGVEVLLVVKDKKRGDKGYSGWLKP